MLVLIAAFLVLAEALDAPLATVHSDGIVQVPDNSEEQSSLSLLRKHSPDELPLREHRLEIESAVREEEEKDAVLGPFESERMNIILASTVLLVVAAASLVVVLVGEIRLEQTKDVRMDSRHLRSFDSNARA
eukprot:TRINITY_DN42405_c0_g1_i1.p1 TRINITY_DN42405_c0_g1~~TRINITY_DN42405_c0_g1_i1.p1  ORF type:complete len:132 (+),score=27.57 TRINITY_DN42405_c0_g1_i1:49-444(+)